MTPGGRRRLLSMAWFLAASLVFGCSHPHPPEGGHADARPNVILISIDTLRADHLSVYGYRRPTSPHLEALAAEGVTFDHYYNSGGTTLPSHLTMLTSLYPYTHGVTPKNGKSLAPGWTTLAEALRAAGYATAAFTDDAWLQAKFGFSQGFDEFNDRGGGFRVILPRAMSWLEDHRDRPFFLFLHTYDVHSEWRRRWYECPGDYPDRYTAGDGVTFDGCRFGKCASRLMLWADTQVKAGRHKLSDLFTDAELKHASSLYDGCINYVDDRLADLFAFLRRQGAFDSSLVVVTSDHGEEFGEHGMLIHEQGGYEELSHIPLILKLPGARVRGKRVEALAATVDLMPTILRIVGVPVPAQAQGKSLLPAIFEGRSVRRDVHMYTVLKTGPYVFFSRRRALYDLRGDPKELHDLYQQRPRLVAKLRATVDREIRTDQLALRAFEAKQGKPGTVKLSAEEIEKLRSLGYLH